ncbi:MAG: N-acetylmuramoyl-L-alanine amidase [Muribaculaceae bacterium]|nr:N-acetylmuramoyl-L-alanine amidase [Muribaculaceae bacterium]
MRTKYALAALALSAATATTQAATTINIHRGDRDTVSTKTHIIVGSTTPGNTVTINGNKTHVYKTGAFGAELPLEHGDNPISIAACDGNTSSETRLNVFRKETTADSKNRPAPYVQETAIAPTPVLTLPDAYLQYGNGDDRLGGSKMGYLADGIPLKVIAETEDLYKVELSQNRTAYIPKRLTSPTDLQPRQANTGSWSLTNTGNRDRVSISLPHRMPYRSWIQPDPTTIHIEIFGATNNSNWITQRGDLGMIEYADCRQTDSDVLEIVIKLKEEHSWGYSVGYTGNNLTIEVKHTPRLSLKHLTIGLDAGHGGEYPGATSATGLKESEINLDIIMRIRDLLIKKGAKTVLSRDGDYSPTMAQRKQTFTDSDVDLMISLHNNSGGSPLKEMGTSTYYKHISNRELASCLLDRMLELGLKNFGLTGNFNFSLNAPTEYPNALIEVLFMSSLPEEEKLADPDFRQKVAEQTVRGIEDYIGKVRHSVTNRKR